MTSQAPRPALEVRSGAPSPEELAALVAALAAVRTAVSAPVARPTRGWASPHPVLRTPYLPGPGAWRASARRH
ncbi:acyl-CoA carboxylase epsilon subunit [Streptomyces sp. NBC_00683]|uniref:acyl-CoA carboxylase epsilon subunit n=1 Tax=Streptomyces sp. NBC_00683 TaxID=2903670 RepID=UPI003FA79F6B